MATSGSIDFSQTRQQLITSSLRLAGVLAAGETASASDASDANIVLNLYIKAFQSKSPHLWRQTRGVLFLTPGTESYQLGSARATNFSDFVSTTLDAAAFATDTTVTLNSVEGLADGDQIGIELSDGTRQWTTINGAPAGFVVTLTDALTADAASGATVYSYTTPMERPLRITEVVRRTSEIDIEVRLVSRQEHLTAPTKTQVSQVLQVHYSPQIGTGTLYVWPTGASVRELLLFTYERNLQDVDSNDDDFDLPAEWLETFRFGLAYRLGIEYGASPQRLRMLKGESEQRESELLAFDQEYASVFFTPDFQRRR